MMAVQQGKARDRTCFRLGCEVLRRTIALLRGRSHPILLNEVIAVRMGQGEQP
jgi:hypothetical protein